jgi:hypothetical protein
MDHSGPRRVQTPLVNVECSLKMSRDGTRRTLCSSVGLLVVDKQRALQPTRVDAWPWIAFWQQIRVGDGAGRSVVNGRRAGHTGVAALKTLHARGCSVSICTGTSRQH